MSAQAGPRPAHRLRAMHVISNLERGGAQEVVRTLAAALRERGCDPLVVALRDGPLRAEIEGSGVQVRVVRGRGHPLVALHRSIPDIIRLRRELQACAVAHRADVIQTHLLGAIDFLVLTLRRPGRRAVFWTVHNSQLELRPDQVPGARWLLRAKRWTYRVLYGVLGRRVDGFIAVSAESADAIRRLYRPPRDRLASIPNGVDTARFPAAVDRARVRRELGLADDVLLAIVVAKLLPQKGHGVLLAALPSVLAAVPRLHVLLAGDGALRDELAAAIQDQGLAGRVLLLGERADVAALLAASDLFVLPSLWEGLPMALLEAMASRVPAVASRVSGTSEVIEDGRSGILVPPGEPQPLGEATLRVLHDPDLASALGQEGRRRVEACYSARAQAELHLALYRAALGWPA